MDHTALSPFGSSHRLLATSLLAAAALFILGCANTGPDTAACSLALALRETEGRSFAPAGDFTPAGYLVEGTGPGGASFSRAVTVPEVLVEGLAAGSWSLSATASNAAGEPVARGEAAAELSGGRTQELTITLRARSGTGTLELSVLWDTELAATPTLFGELIDAAGSSAAVVFEQTQPGQASESTPLEAGWYTLLVRLYDAATLVAGAAEATLIRADAVTTGSIEFRGAAPAMPDALALTLALDLPSTLALTMAGQLAEVEPSQCMTVETYPWATLNQSWYLDGVSIGTGHELALTAPTSLGRHRLDTIGLDPGGVAVASLSHVFTVLGSVQGGLLTPAIELSDGTLGVQGLRGARAAALSPDGLFLYATGYDSDSVTVFSRSPSTGMLRFAGKVTDGAAGVDGLDGAEGCVMSPDGRHLYVAGYLDDKIATLATTVSGALEYVGTSSGLDGVRSVEVSPDGAFVYAAVSATDSVSVLSRDPSSGALSPVSSVVNGAGGISLLQGPTDLAVSADGAHLYVAAYDSDAVLWFARDSVSGALSYLGAVSDEAGGVHGLNGPHGIALTPDGLTLLAVSYYDKALVWFSRDPATGALAYLGSAVDGVAGVDGLYYARDVAVSPTGGTVWVAGGGEDAVAVFRREGPASPLRFLAKVAVADGPRGLAPSADGKSLYVCSSGAGTITLMCVSP